MPDGFHNKLVFVGDMGAGKTTAIRAISDAEPISTEMPLSEADRTAEKSTTTVALDYSTVELGDGELLHIYGVPGQTYLDFMWPMVCEGALGVIVLVDASNPNLLATTEHLLNAFARMAPDASFAIGVTRCDLVADFRLIDIRSALLARGFKLPIMKLDARVPAQVEFLIKTLLSYSYAAADQHA